MVKISVSNVINVEICIDKNHQKMIALSLFLTFFNSVWSSKSTLSVTFFGGEVVDDPFSFLVVDIVMSSSCCCSTFVSSSSEEDEYFFFLFFLSFL